jgi:hypothetical protein
MKNEDLLKESIQLILNYESRSVIVEFKKYKTLEDIKEKVYDLFYPIKNKINIYSNNKNLEPLLDQPIGYIFSGKSLVNLKIVNEEINESPYKLVKRYKISNIIEDVTNVYNRLNFHKSPNKMNITSLNNENNILNDKIKNFRNLSKKHTLLLSKNKLQLLKSELNKEDNIIIENRNKNMLKSKSMDNFDELKYPGKKANNKIIGKLPPITLKSTKINNKRLKIDIIPKKINLRVNSTKNSESKNMKNILYNKCNNCFINKISTYCRTCDSFLCQNCSSNKKSLHQDHKNTLIILDINKNSENITKYKDIILSNFSLSNDYFDKLDINTKKNKTKNKKEKFDYDNIITKLGENMNKLVNKANEMKNSMKKFEFNKNVNDDEEKVKEICDNEKKVLKKFDVYEYQSQFQPFFVLNQFERNMAKYFNNYEASNDQRIYIKSQIELMFDNVENEVDNALDNIDKIIWDMKI